MKINSGHFFLLLGSIIVLQACVKPFMPKLEKYEELLVVDGCITDAPGPYTVKLSRSTSVSRKSMFIPYTRCKVAIMDRQGKKAILTEHASGIYQTDSADIRGVAGMEYKVSISTPEGETYESAFQSLLKVNGIQSAYAELEHKNDNHTSKGRDGYQFYVDIENASVTNTYLLWRMECTYKFKTDFAIYYYYDNGMHPVDFNDTLRTCYRTLSVPGIYVLNTGAISPVGLKHIPINYEDNYTKALSIRYSLKINQYSISKDAYIYWNTIKKMMDQQGELYTQQPYQVINNLINLTNPDKPALGYFTVAGVTEKRIFVNPPPVIMQYPKCIMDTMPPISDPLKWIINKPGIWPVFFTLDYFYNRRYLEQDCLDCRITGKLMKPDFWID